MNHGPVSRIVSTAQPLPSSVGYRALDAVPARAAPPEGQTPSIGCNIKWKAGAAPDY